MDINLGGKGLKIPFGLQSNFQDRTLKGKSVT